MSNISFEGKYEKRNVYSNTPIAVVNMVFLAVALPSGQIPEFYYPSTTVTYAAIAIFVVC